jgi:hypothetical protein
MQMGIPKSPMREFSRSLTYTPPLLLRRDFLSIVALSFVANQEKCDLAPPAGHFVQAAASLIRRNCCGYLRAFEGKPFLPMWRGGDPPGIQRPPSDLLNSDIYGDAGVAFFSTLAKIANEFGVEPANAHIATGSKDDAAAWGSPVSVWPIGEQFQHMFWESRRLIYDPAVDDLPFTRDVQTLLAQTGTPVVGKHLHFALEDSREVLFQMSESGYLVIDEMTTESLTALLNQQIV